MFNLLFINMFQLYIFYYLNLCQRTKDQPIRMVFSNGGRWGIRTPAGYYPLLLFESSLFSQTWVIAHMVPTSRFELLTYSLPWSCSTNWAKSAYSNYKQKTNLFGWSFQMAGDEGFEPPRAVKPLLVFKTSPFSQTWVIAQKVLLNYYI